jgi:DNA-binding response OmpR family regulator
VSRILLIEPDYILGSIYRKAFEDIGHQVILANGAQSGIMAADKAKPDLVILEIQLVEHSGIEFLYEFMSYCEWQDVPVVINTHVPISEFVGSWDILKEVLGIKEYLYKPQTSLTWLLKSAEALTAQRV